MLTDVYTSTGVFIGIIVIYFTGLTIIDPIIALVITLLIFKVAIGLLRESLKNIVDTRLSKEDEEIINTVLRQHAFKFVQFYELRTRKAGSERHIDLHLVVPYHYTITFVRELCDCIEKDIGQCLPEVHILIHAEPCNPSQNECQTCTFRQHAKNLNKKDMENLEGYCQIIKSDLGNR